MTRSTGGAGTMEGMPPPSTRTVSDYYRGVAPALLPHLAGRRVRPAPDRADGAHRAESAGSADGARLMPAPADLDELLALVGRGMVAMFTEPAGRIALHLVPGDGADVATVATAVLQVAEQCAADGLRAVPLTDGADGLWLLARTDGDPAAAAERYAVVLGRTAPELATLDPAQADGRSLITIHADDARADVPVPYSLLPGGAAFSGVATPSGDATFSGDAALSGGATTPADTPAAIPLHLDEIAAITAGMPAELTSADVAERIAVRGDLAAALLATPTA